MSSKRKDKVRVTFCGTNATEVTGSCTHIEAGEKQYLLECGLFQSVKSIWENYQINTRKFKFKAKNINAIFVGHCHIDHIGLIPVMYAHGCTAPICIPSGNFELFKILLEDCAFINNRDAETLSYSREKEYAPLYTINDVATALTYVKEIPFNTPFVVDEQTTVEFIGSGHILNAGQIIVKTKINNVIKTIAYSSDLGNIAVDNKYVTPFSPIKKADLFIGETTYANAPKGVNHKDRVKDLEKVKSIVDNVCIENKGKVLIPCFASSRTQSIISHLYDLYGNDENFDIPVLIDSPMACKITKLYVDILPEEQKKYYQQVLAWKNLIFVDSIEESKWWRENNSPCIVCSASGMLTAGRSVAWVTKLLPNSNNHIIFVGYIPVEGGIGIKIKEGKYKTLTVGGKRVTNKCGITSLKSFSSHMQYKELLNYYSKIQSPKIALVHGEQKAKISFAKELQEKISKNNSTNRVIITNKETSVTI